MATTMTFTGTADPDWVAKATDAPDPEAAGVQAVISLVARDGAVLVVTWADGREPDGDYLAYWAEQADRLGLHVGAAQLDAGVAVTEYQVVRPAGSGHNTVKGVPCILVKRT